MVYCCAYGDFASWNCRTIYRGLRGYAWSDVAANDPFWEVYPDTIGVAGKITHRAVIYIILVDNVQHRIDVAQDCTSRLGDDAVDFFE